MEVISSPNAKKVRCPRESAAPKAYCSETTLFRDGTDQRSVQSVAPLKSAKLRTTELSTGKRAEFSGNYQKRPGETLRFVRLYMNQSAKLTGSSSPIIQSPFSSSSLCKPGFSPPGFSFAVSQIGACQVPAQRTPHISGVQSHRKSHTALARCEIVNQHHIPTRRRTAASHCAQTTSQDTLSHCVANTQRNHIALHTAKPQCIAPHYTPRLHIETHVP